MNGKVPLNLKKFLFQPQTNGNINSRNINDDATRPHVQRSIVASFLTNFRFQRFRSWGNRTNIFIVVSRSHKETYVNRPACRRSNVETIFHQWFERNRSHRVWFEENLAIEPAELFQRKTKDNNNRAPWFELISDEPFSGLRSQWTMDLLCKYLKATRTCFPKTKEVKLFSCSKLKWSQSNLINKKFRLTFIQPFVRLTENHFQHVWMKFFHHQIKLNSDGETKTHRKNVPISFPFTFPGVSNMAWSWITPGCEISCRISTSRWIFSSCSLNRVLSMTLIATGWFVSNEWPSSRRKRKRFRRSNEQIEIDRTSVNSSELSATKNFDRIEFVQFIDISSLLSRWNNAENTSHFVSIGVVCQQCLSNLRISVSSVQIWIDEIVFL